MCEDDDNENSTDGRVPALIVRHVRNEVFIVRFVDCTELRVDFDKTKVWRANRDIGEATRRKLVSAPILPYRSVLTSRKQRCGWPTGMPEKSHVSEVWIPPQQESRS